MMMRMYGLKQNSYVDGPGIRMAIFFQGCLHHCNGCHNHNSWPLFGGVKMDTDELVEKMAKDPLLDGITLSGGEPFLQPNAAVTLAEAAKKAGLSVWCYTGYTFEEIMQWRDKRKKLMGLIDVLVDGPFLIEQKSFDTIWRGSKNQRLIDVKKSLEKGEVVLYEKP